MAARLPLLAGPVVALVAIAGCTGTGDEGWPPPSGEEGCNDTLVATPAANGDIALEWGSVPDVTSYQIFLREGEETWVPLSDLSGSETSLTFAGTPGTVYEFKVTAMEEEEPVAHYCAVTATSIPDFPAMGSLVLAATGALAGYGLLQRRKA
jgi:hypothetical protein